MSERSGTLFNFLDPKLCPSVSCNSPVTDNYEVDNLISDDVKKKHLGYLAYSSVKPPVEIEFKFICPVNIHYIILKTTVGSQKSNGIEVLAKNDRSEYTYICRSMFSQPGVYFCNSKFYSDVDKPKGCDSDLYHLAYFNRHSFKVFLEATTIKLIIFKTEKSVPCLGSIEVWGLPAKCCSKTTQNTIAHLMKKKYVPNVDTNIDKFSIPQDFQDDLTYELMTIPFTLPSGKTVDQSTLDKHVECEARFGRKPCDPFTGIKFTKNLKPVLNMGLKNRIDMFMLNNHSRPELMNCKRILGKSNTHKEQYKKIKISINNSDLEEAITKVKESEGFLCVTNENVVNKNECISCKNQENFLYKIPCEHCYCRKCLVTISVSLICSICEQPYTTKDIIKINV